jgi:hypothetical protein
MLETLKIQRILCRNYSKHYFWSKSHFFEIFYLPVDEFGHKACRTSVLVRAPVTSGFGSWQFPLTCIPTSFYLENLVSIELVNSSVEFLWKKAQVLIFISCSIFGFVVISNFDPVVRPYRIDPVQVRIILRPYIYTEMYPFFKYFAKVITNECIKENDTKIQWCKYFTFHFQG